MSERNNGVSNALTYSAMGIIAGIVFGAVFWVIADYEVLQAIFAGAATAVIVTLILALVLGGSSRVQGGPVAPGSAGVKAGSAGGSEAPTAASSSQPASESAGTGAAQLTSATPSATPVSAAEVKPSKELPGQKELSERKGSWKYEADAAPVAAEKAPKQPAAPKAKPAAAAGPEEEPDLMKAPRGGSADDLKKISGVGPKLEQTLNEMGIWHFDQVSKWTDTEIAWVDSRLKFKGRIVRDDWIGQAKILAAGGETEFSKRKKN